MACERGHLELVKYFVEMGADFQTRDNYAIRYASQNGHLEVVKCLVENGVDFKVLNNFAVRTASVNGHLEVVKYLVEKGADFRALDNNTCKLATWFGHKEVEKYLISLGTLKEDAMDVFHPTSCRCKESDSSLSEEPTRHSARFPITPEAMFKASYDQT